jgi:hypothetical protein
LAAFGADKIFFVSFPSWFVAVLVYVALSRSLQRSCPSDINA